MNRQLALQVILAAKKLKQGFDFAMTHDDGRVSGRSSFTYGKFYLDKFSTLTADQSILTTTVNLYLRKFPWRKIQVLEAATVTGKPPAIFVFREGIWVQEFLDLCAQVNSKNFAPV